MKCTQCGVENSENATFCRYCGKNLKLMNIDSSPKFCFNCGFKLESSWNFCPECKSPVGDEVKSINTDKSDENKIFKICIIYIVCSILLPFFLFFAYYTALRGKTKYPDNISFKILYWIITIILIVCTVLFVLEIKSCFDSFKSCNCPG